jgi:hypothetical protein
MVEKTMSRYARRQKALDRIDELRTQFACVSKLTNDAFVKWGHLDALRAPYETRLAFEEYSKLDTQQEILWQELSRLLHQEGSIRQFLDDQFCQEALEKDQHEPMTTWDEFQRSIHGLAQTL